VRAAGVRITCRNCDRVFRAGTRAERRNRRDDSVPEDGAAGVQKLLFVVAGVALLVAGLVMGGAVAAWYFANRVPPQAAADNDEIEVDEPPQPNPALVERAPIDNRPVDREP
jgi:hypothetical protein